MGAYLGGGFRRRTPQAARPAFIATAVLIVVGLGTFVVVTALASISLGVSPLTAIFGPVPGNPVIMWLYFVLPAVLVQGAVALSLRHPAVGLRVAGMAGAFAIAGFCLLWLGAVALDLVAWLVTGTTRGDPYDWLAILFFGVPFALAIGGLDARAGLLTLRDLRKRGGARLAPS
jgi:hypothetical protein